MRYEYNFYITDESFDYGDFPGATVTEAVKHGFSIEIDSANKVDINSLESYGDYSQIQDEIKTLQDLLDYIEVHLSEVEEHDENEIITNYFLFLELTDIIKEQIMDDYNKKYAELILTGNVPVNPHFLYEYKLPEDFEIALYLLGYNNREEKISNFEICLNKQNERVLICDMSPVVVCYKPNLETENRKVA